MYINMELEGLFSGTKWDILTELSKKDLSPLQISKRLNTSIANISQQIRLLEAYGIVSRKKISASGAGKPRTIFSIKDDLILSIGVMKNFARKKLIKADEHHKTILNIWALDARLHYCLEKFYWKIEPGLKNIRAFGISSYDENRIKLEFIAKNRKFVERLNNTKISNFIITAKVVDLEKIPEEISPIYDPERLFSKTEQSGENERGDNSV